MFNPDQLGQLVRLLLKAEENGVSFDAIKFALQNIQPPVVEVVKVEPEQPALTITEYAIPVDYSLPIKEAVKAGEYVWDNTAADNFPTLARETGQKDLKFVLAHFNRTMSSNYVVASMNKLGYRPATAREILSFGAKLPDLQTQFSIAALGQWVKIEGYNRVLCLGSFNSCRSLRLYPFGSNWHDSCRFLFVKK